MIKREEVEKIASLARLHLTDEEKNKFAQQLSAVLTSFQELSTIDTAGVQPLVTPTEIEPFFREDRVETWPETEAALANAPETSGRLFNVPPVV